MNTIQRTVVSMIAAMSMTAAANAADVGKSQTLFLSYQLSLLGYEVDKDFSFGKKTKEAYRKILSSIGISNASSKDEAIHAIAKRYFSDFELDEKMKEEVKSALSKSLKDPYSAVYEFSKARKSNNGRLVIVCGSINAKNSYGAYIGVSKFTAKSVLGAKHGDTEFWTSMIVTIHDQTDAEWYYWHGCQ